MNRHYLKILFVFLLICTYINAQENEYPYWGIYEKTDMWDVRSSVWNVKDITLEGWDWSLPPNTKASPKGLICLARILNVHNTKIIDQIKKVHFECNAIVEHWVKWSDIETTEGKYDFTLLKRNIEAVALKGYGSSVRILSSSINSAPQWMDSKYHIPIRKEPRKAEGVENYQIDNAVFHRKYCELIAAFGKSGIPNLQEVKGLYLGYASPTHGDEGIGPFKQDPDTVKNVLARIDAWVSITKGIAYKVFMGGNCNYGFQKGFGVRRGFIEMYLYELPAPEIGQEIDNKGYVVLNEKCPLIAKECLHGEVNEEYEEKWATEITKNRYGFSTASFPYRYFSSNLRLLQMRCNLAIYNEFSLDPALTAWIALELGRTAKTTPDAWCFLRESYLKIGKQTAKNFERWVYQRDTIGYETEAVVKIKHAIEMWMVEPGKYYDFIARTGDKIGFNVDKNFLTGKLQKVAVKITYLDQGSGTWNFAFDGLRGKETREVKCLNTNKMKTATFFICANFNQEKNKFDFECQSKNGLKPVVSFVRVIK